MTLGDKSWPKRDPFYPAVIGCITKELFTKITNITTKLNWKLFTNVIRAKGRNLGLL
jgi:hypothetical protein